MTEHHLPLRATVKSGSDFSAPWLTVDANDPNDLVFKLDALLNSDASAKVIELASQFKAANNLAPVLPSGPAPTPAPTPAPASNGWRAPAQQPQQQAPAWSGGPQNGSPHPENKSCPCGQVLQYKSGTSKAGKAYKLWACPNQRQRGDGHVTEFVD